MLQIESLPTGQGPFLQFQGLLLAVGKERYRAGLLGGERQVRDPFVLPCHVDGDAATGTDAAYLAVLPVLRQGWQELEGR